jgi:hypothetical protein
MAFISCSIFRQRPWRSKQRSAALTQTVSTPTRSAASLGSKGGRQLGCQQTAVVYIGIIGFYMVTI